MMGGINMSMFAVDKMIRKEGFNLRISAYSGKAMLYNLLFDGSKSNILQIQPDKNGTQWNAIFGMAATEISARNVMIDYLKSPKSISTCYAVLPSLSMGLCEEFMHESRSMRGYFANLDSAFHALAGAVSRIYDGSEPEMEYSVAELLRRAEQEQFLIDTDSELIGVKAGLSAKSRKKTLMELHEDNCHVGHMPGCLVCAMVKLTAAPLTSNMEVLRESRPCYKVHIDTATMNVKSRQGNIYATLMYCEGCDRREILFDATKTTIVANVKKLIVRRRRMPIFQGYQATSFAPSSNGIRTKYGTRVQVVSRRCARSSASRSSTRILKTRTQTA